MATAASAAVSAASAMAATPVGAPVGGAAGGTVAAHAHTSVSTTPAAPAAPARRGAHMPFLAGALGGSIAAAILNPLDILRTRLQSAQLAANSLPPHRVLASIVRHEGVLALWRGLVPTILGIGPSRAIYFGSYAAAKQELGPGGSGGLRGTALDLTAATVGGLATNTIMSPWWVIRTRLQLQHTPVEPGWRRLWRQWRGGPGASAAAAAAAAASAATATATSSAAAAAGTVRAGGGLAEGYRGVVHCAQRIWAEEGWRAFYRGLTASYLGVTETAAQFALYGEMKRSVIESRLPAVYAAHAAAGRATPTPETARREAFSDGAAFSTSAASKLIAASLTYPHEVLRTRMREQHSAAIKYRSVMHTLRTVVAEEGIRGLYGGLSVHLVRTVPNAAILLLVVEKLVGGSV